MRSACVKCGCLEDGIWLFVVPSNRTRSSGPKLMHRKANLNMRKNFFTVQVTMYWNREVLEASSLEIFQSRLNTILVHVFWGFPAG